MPNDDFDHDEIQTDPAYDAVEMPTIESPIAHLLASVAAERPADAAEAFNDILRDKIADFVATRREEMERTLFAGPRDEEDDDQDDLFGDDEDGEPEGDDDEDA